MRGVVLAGGRSSRMGSNKALIPWAGGTLLEHMKTKLASALEIEIGQIWVSGEVPGHDGIPDRIPGMGPIAGASAVMEQMSGDFEDLLLLPVDMPLITTESLQRLIREWNAISREGIWDGCRFHGSELPLILRSTTRVRGELDRLLHSEVSPSDRSFRTLGKCLHWKEIQPEDDFILINMNTPSDRGEVERVLETRG